MDSTLENKVTKNNLNVKQEKLKNIDMDECNYTDKEKNKIQYVNKWIEKEENNFEKSEADDQSSIPENSIDDQSSIPENSDVTSNISYNNNLLDKFDDLEINSAADDNDFEFNYLNENQSVLNSIDGLKQTITKITSVSSSLKNIGNVSIANSKDVRIGNVTYITGPIHVTNTGGGNIGSIKQKTSPDNQKNKKQKSFRVNCSKTDAEFNEENAPRKDCFLGNDVQCVIQPTTLRIVPRRLWLAQKPMNPYEYIDGPVPYVVISHTATESPTTQPENVLVIRYIQVFHVEGQKWDDIGYNFLVGGDGQVYEGRGFGVVGAHAQGYNRMSVGISFVGCFMKELPTENSLNTCKLLIQSGVEQGYIAEDYKLVGHCQCSPTESPGRMLYEELKTWPNFCNIPKL
ncbi:peptidoglycan-recognition protein LE-like [Condylostylus longicornis]|uniref:peptidoglycan-recognition protein LE-like n=1 Tax=Condylostylus longicornis TaxID=2530218 RepID=UPI00244E3C99|nr:peptidoglycan-recognition protein LE-like [Condylostylus longicornis]